MCDKNCKIININVFKLETLKITLKNDEKGEFNCLIKLKLQNMNLKQNAQGRKQKDSPCDIIHIILS